MNFQFISVFALELTSKPFNWKILKVETHYANQRLGLEGFGSQILVNVKPSFAVTHSDEI